MQKLRGTRSSDSSPTLHQLAKKTLNPQKLTIWMHNLFTVTSCTNEPLIVLLSLNGANLIMEIDTGAARSVISEKTFTELWPKVLQHPLKPTDAALKT